MRRPVGCREFRDRLVDFQADELPLDVREAFQAHLDECAGCARRHEVEEGLLAGLRARMRPHPAPPGLETRIRAALASEAGGGSAIPWFRSGAWAALAASLLLGTLLVWAPGGPGEVPVRTALVTVAAREVVVVDEDCDRAGHDLTEQRNCRIRGHLNALKLDDGNYWNVSQDDGVGRRLLVDPGLRGRRIVVRGELYPGIHTLRLDGYDPVGDAVDRAADETVLPAAFHR